MVIARCRKKLPDGRYRWVRLPLTLEDVLHPRLGDVHMLGDPHDDDCNYLKDVLKARYRGRSARSSCSPTAGSSGIFPACRHHSPDLAVIFGVKRRKDWKTFHVKIEKVRPSLIIEVTSPKTRVMDVKTKVNQYARAKVPRYVIADAQRGEAESDESP